jgi:hypothetical protein
MVRGDQASWLASCEGWALRSRFGGALLRRWYVVVAAMLIIGAAEVELKPMVDYYSDVHILFYAPQNSYTPLLSTNYQAIALAGVVQLAVTGTQSGAHTSSATVTLQGEGVYDGYSVLLPNSGGQWSNDFVNPELDVQVTGHNPELVRQRMTSIISRISTEARTRQQALGTASKYMINTTLSPSVIDVYEGKGSHVRALATVFILGIGLMIASVKAVDRRRPAEPSPQPGALGSHRSVAGARRRGWPARLRPAPEGVR